MPTTLHLTHEHELPRAAQAVLDHLPDGGTVLLRGDLGAGKTALVKACCKLLGVADAVSSPTFSIVNEYVLPAGKRVYHLDLYRLESPEEVEDIGLDEYLHHGRYCFIEWPEVAGGLLPASRLNVNITVVPEGGRKVVLL